MNEILGQNAVVPATSSSTQDYYQIGSCTIARQQTTMHGPGHKRVDSYDSPVKQARVHGIMQSDRMRESLSHKDNDVTYGLSQVTKPGQGDLAQLFSGSSLKKEVWKPKTTL